MSDQPTVFIVDDDPAFAESLAVLVSSMQLPVKLFGSADEYLAQFDPEASGCLILDVRMPKMSGLSLQEELVKKPLCPAIIVMTGYAEVPTALRAMKQGAVDFLQKTFSESELVDAIQRAIAKDKENRDAFSRKNKVDSLFSQISPAERQVLEFVLKGEPNKRIASALGVSRRTVEDRRARVMQKLEVESLADLVRLAIEAGVHRE